MKTVHHDQEGPKISWCLGELIDPYFWPGMTLEQYRKLVTMGAMAWNLSNFKDPLRSPEFDRLVGTVEPEVASDLTDILQTLLARKLSCFPNDHRVIVTFDVSTVRGQFHIQAASVRAASPSKLEALDQQPVLSAPASDE